MLLLVLVLVLLLLFVVVFVVLSVVVADIDRCCIVVFDCYAWCRWFCNQLRCISRRSWCWCVCYLCATVGLRLFLLAVLLLPL